MTRPICKFHTVVFSSIINPYFMLWVIFPIPDPATSFKKIHVPIRLAHRHSFNEQINHSDGYNGVITGFKYDNLHPNGAAKALAHSRKKGRQKLVILSFLFFLFPHDSRHEDTWALQKVLQEGSSERGPAEQFNNSGAIIVLQGQTDSLVPEKPSAMMRKYFRSLLSA